MSKKDTLTIHINSTLHGRLKKELAGSGLSLQNYVEDKIIDGLRNDKQMLKELKDKRNGII